VSAELPSAEEAAELPLEELAMRVLQVIRDGEGSGGVAMKYNLLNREALERRVGGTSDEIYSLLRLLQEAWDWLYVHGLITSDDPNRRGEGLTFVTRRGHEVLGESEQA
jgi:hypothetical protein